MAKARADLAAAVLVGAAGPSVFAMLTQMVFEKFATAALLRSGSITLASASRTHNAASLMVAAMRIQRGLMAPMGGTLVWHAAMEAATRRCARRRQPSPRRSMEGPAAVTSVPATPEIRRYFASPTERGAPG